MDVDVHQQLSKGLRDPSLLRSSLITKLKCSPLATNERMYNLLLRLEGADKPPEFPDQSNVDVSPKFLTLDSSEEYEATIREIQSLGLHPHPDDPKNWDSLAALNATLGRTSNNQAVLDAGGAVYSPLIEWLYLYGYDDLYVYNIDFDRDFERGPIRYVNGDFTDTQFPAGRFDVITSLSVLEHGVDVRVALEEFYRLLDSDGVLVISTDYWPDQISTNGISTQYGSEIQQWNVFNRVDINQLLDIARDIGFETPCPVNYSANNRVIEWRGKEFTFLYLELRVA